VFHAFLLGLSKKKQELAEVREGGRGCETDRKGDEADGGCDDDTLKIKETRKKTAIKIIRFSLMVIAAPLPPQIANVMNKSREIWHSCLRLHLNAVCFKTQDGVIIFPALNLCRP